MEKAVSALAEELPPPTRLAIAYAPRPVRRAWTALLVLDQRLRRAALGASEPLLAQIRLAWWRDRFHSPASEWPEGEPLLAALATFDEERGALVSLVDGWERVLGGEADDDAIAGLIEARAQAMVALARIVGCRDASIDVAALARKWARWDVDRAASADLPPAFGLMTTRMPHPMRPLVVLAGFAQGDHGLRGLLRIIRLGLFGR